MCESAKQHAIQYKAIIVTLLFVRRGQRGQNRNPVLKNVKYVFSGHDEGLAFTLSPRQHNLLKGSLQIQLTQARYQSDSWP